MKRAGDFWVTGPFPCYFVRKEVPSCHADMVTEPGRHTLYNSSTFNTGVQATILNITFIKVTESQRKKLQDKNTSGNCSRVVAMITLQDTTGFPFIE